MDCMFFPILDNRSMLLDSILRRYLQVKAYKMYKMPSD